MTTYYRKCQNLVLSNYKIISFYFRFSEKAINCETISQKNFVPLSEPNEQNRDMIHYLCIFQQASAEPQTAELSEMTFQYN